MVCACVIYSQIVGLWRSLLHGAGPGAGRWTTGTALPTGRCDWLRYMLLETTQTLKCLLGVLDVICLFGGGKGVDNGCCESLAGVL